MKNMEIRLAARNGALDRLLEHEALRRIRAEYSPRREADILRGTDGEASRTYTERVRVIKTEVRTEILSAAGKGATLSWEPPVETKKEGKLKARVAALEATVAELQKTIKRLEGRA